MKTPHVMVIEDHDSLREATVALLRQKGFDAAGVPCAEDLDDTHFSRAPNIYVVDLNLPEEDGLSLVRRLRRAQPLAGIVITTARTQTKDLQDSYDVGADFYLPKPVNPQELIAILGAMAKRLANAELEVALKLIEAQALLRGPKGESKLSSAETRLLIALARAKDQMLERWQIIAHLGIDDSEISADALQNRLSQLRKKIAACGIEGDAIRAIRGMGYWLCVPLVVV